MGASSGWCGLAWNWCELVSPFQETHGPAPGLAKRHRCSHSTTHRPQITRSAGRWACLEVSSVFRQIPVIYSTRYSAKACFERIIRDMLVCTNSCSVCACPFFVIHSLFNNLCSLNQPSFVACLHENPLLKPSTTSIHSFSFAFLQLIPHRFRCLH